MYRTLLTLLTLSGAAALCCEVVWMRRLSLALGSTGVAIALTLAAYMGGLGLGSLWASRRGWGRAPMGYGLCELSHAAWAVAFPWLLAAVGHPWAGVALLVPPAVALGATLPAASGAVRDARQVAGLYLFNTLGAVGGVLAGPFLLLPALGLRRTELAAAGVSALVGLVAVVLARRRPAEALLPRTEEAVPWGVLAAAATAGGVAMALEVVWTRLAALLIGSSVFAMATVLAVFLACVSAGTAWGRRTPGRQALARWLGALGGLAAAGTVLYGVLPYGLGLAYAGLGEGAILPVGALLLVAAMAGAPVASGAVFAVALDAAGGDTSVAAGRVLAANTLAGVVGAAGAGLFLLPWLGIWGTVALVSGLAGVVAAALHPPGRLRVLGPLAVVAVLLLSPRWDKSLYAAGLFHRLSEFNDLSPGAVDRYAHDGWSLVFYEDGRSATVAVGRSDRSGNRWLTVNGKVDASTGTDMPTQQTSGRLPVLVAGGGDVLVVGLASGVTAGEALAAGADSLTVVELEPAVVRASDHFRDVNLGVLKDPRTTLVVGDARSWLARPGPSFDVIISEPSNPWITGVSNLFTEQYWQLGKARLRPGGVFCQWVQLYALPPDGLMSLVHTYESVFGRVWLFQTIEGADALLLAADELPEDLDYTPLLTPEQVSAFSQGARLNTDDAPWIEFEAPKWLQRWTGRDNQALLEAAAE